MFVTVTGNCTFWPGEAASVTRLSASARFGTCLTVNTNPVSLAPPGALLAGGAAVTVDSCGSMRAMGVGDGAGVGRTTATCAGGVRRGVGCGVALTIGLLIGGVMF